MSELLHLLKPSSICSLISPDVGGRSMMVPFLGMLGASATIVGVVAGLGEPLGYSLRSASGWPADKKKQTKRG